MRLTIYNLRRRKYLEPYNITKLQNVYVYLFVLRIGLIRVLNHTVQSPKCLIHLYIDDLYICISMIYVFYLWSLHTMISIISNYALSMKATLCFTRINSKQFFMKLIGNHKNKYTRKEFCLRVIEKHRKDMAQRF